MALSSQRQSSFAQLAHCMQLIKMHPSELVCILAAAWFQERRLLVREVYTFGLHGMPAGGMKLFQEHHGISVNVSHFDAGAMAAGGGGEDADR